MSPCGGDERVRTADPLLAKQVLSRLSYTPASSQTRVSPASELRAFQPYPDNHIVIPNASQKSANSFNLALDPLPLLFLLTP